MKLKALLKPFTTFRAQLVAFIAAMLIVTALVITLINQQLEKRTNQQIDEYIRAITQATDTVYRSFSEGSYLYNIVNTGDPNSLTIDSESFIRRILIVTEDGRIYDSSDRGDLGREFKSIVADAPALQTGDLKRDIDGLATDQNRILNLTIETEKAKRQIYIIISFERLKRVKDTIERDRLFAFAGLGLILIIAIAFFSKRMTRPITELGDAARRVTEGDIYFKVPLSGPGEVSALAKTFNEMLSGLRNKAELEDQLQRAERSAMVGRLASGIAHEIRNPLNFINLSIDYIRDKYAPAEETGRTEFTRILTTIKDELARLNRLVSDFLSYGRPANLKLRRVDARTLIEEVRELVSAKAESQNVRIDIRQNGGMNSVLNADPEQLKTCFSNLMINAVQAMPEGGSLEIDVHSDDSEVGIEFRDTGVGIPAGATEQIFEPYYSTKETGIGLGLPLTRKIIEEHSGRIEVSSEIGKGTTFTVTLQRDPAIKETK